MSLLRRFVQANVGASRALDRVLPQRVREDGNGHFHRFALPIVLQPGMRVYDLGGGSRPCVSAEEKRALDLQVVGLDLSAEELAAAPEGVYDRTIAADLCTFTGPGDADVVVCQATLEHVPDTAGAMRAIASCLRPGGRAVIFAPCRNAVFARLNLWLPENVKRRLLFALFPAKADGHEGFPAFYDRCTPRQIEALAEANALRVARREVFWISSYFTAFLPAFVAWRMWQGLAWLTVRDEAAESFWYLLEKPVEVSQSAAA